MGLESVAEVLQNFAQILKENFVILLWTAMLGWTLLMTFPLHSFRAWVLILVLFAAGCQFSIHVAHRAILAKFLDSLNDSVSEYAALRDAGLQD